MDINFCPTCMFQPSICKEGASFFLECPYCRKRGKHAASINAAIELWNTETYDDFCNMQDYLDKAVHMCLE